MTIAATLLPEFDNEMKITRTLLERVPDDRAAWKPHAKSAAMGELAIHLPGLVSMIPFITSSPEMDIVTHGKDTPRWQSSAEALALFDRVVAAARAAIASATDESLGQTWSLKAGDHTIIAVPRANALRVFVMNHIIHHRGQLSVYLRLNDIPLPEIYGPNADSAR